MGIGKMFSDPNLFSKLAANPRTAKLLADASFMQKARIIISLFSPPCAMLTTRMICSSNLYNRTRSSRRVCSVATHA